MGVERGHVLRWSVGFLDVLAPFDSEAASCGHLPAQQVMLLHWY